MKTLSKNISSLSFYEREKVGGNYVRNKCGRDFLYYALNYYHPDQFNSVCNNPKEIDMKKWFGYPTPAVLAWTQLQFSKVHHLFSEHHLSLSINGKLIKSFFNFFSAILFSRMDVDTALKGIEVCVDTNTVCGVDISLGSFGLLDHVMFVYGYDEKNLYVVDTHKVAGLEYEKVGENNFFFSLPKDVVRKRWTRFGRVWRVAGI